MSGRIARRTLATVITLAAAVGASGLTAGAASASPEPGPPLCRDLDVRMTATKAQDSPSGHHVVNLHYTAADPDTNCTLSGSPYGMEFYNAANKPLGVESSVQHNGKEERVKIDSQHSASSSVLIPNGPKPGAQASALRLHLPSDASRTPVGTMWPDGSDLTGTPKFMNITQD